MQRALTDVVTRGDFTVPPYPAVALRLQRLLARESYGVGEVADVIATDAALATTVLASANSALLGAAVPITSLSRAVNRLGARTVGSIALASSVGQASLTAGVLLDVRFRIWRRAMMGALTAQRLAPARGLAPEEGFLATLLHGFGRSIAVASLEVLLKRHSPPRPLTLAEWLSIADEQRPALARAISQSWQLPPVIAEAIDATAKSPSPLNDLVTCADAIAGELDAGRTAPGRNPEETRLIAELVSELPALLEALTPPAPPAPARPPPPSQHLAKPSHALGGALRPKTINVVDRRTKGAAPLTCLALAPSGLELECAKPFQESSMVKLSIGEEAQRFDSWFTVVLCVAKAPGYRAELELFSPTREVRERWQALYEG